MTARLILVDDDEALTDLMVDRLRHAGFEVEGFTDAATALRALSERPVDLLITDVEMPGLRGTDLLVAAHARQPDLPVLMMTGFGTVELAVQCLRAGAVDFLSKPFPFEKLRHAVQRVLRERDLAQEVRRARIGLHAEDPWRSTDPAMLRVEEQAARAARADCPLLVLGESGVGKTLLAREMHARSRRGDKPFLAVNAATLPPPLAEAELFGVRKGAFTDAQADRPGLFERADGGTLLLDEVGEMPLSVQPKLLQILEQRTLRRVGDTVDRPIDVRVIAATHVDLAEAVRLGTFRADLYYRLAVVSLHVPALRERPADLPPLIERLLRRAADRAGRPELRLSDEALQALLAHPWPGNVRELGNAIERAVILADGPVLRPDDLLARPVPITTTHDGSLDTLAGDGWTLDQVRDAYIERVLARVGQNKSEAARVLGIDRKTLYRRGEAS